MIIMYLDTLPKKYDLSKIDWDECNKFASNSLVKVACDLWNDGIKPTKKIGNILNLHYSTVIRYLRIGNSLGICNYKSHIKNIS